MINKKLDKLKTILSRMESVLVAYSGGVDSSFLLKVAKDTLKTPVLAAIAVSETYSEKELREAVKFANKLKVEYLIINTKELMNPKFAGNTKNRCYWCKMELFGKLKKIAEKRNMKEVIDGTNSGDIYDYRPGMIASR